MYDYRAAEIPPALTTVLTRLHPDDAERVAHAFRFAAAAHATHSRDEGTPFIDHPVAVAVILSEELGCRDVDVLVAALNHDVLEDCDSDFTEAVEGVIGVRATGFVGDVTKERVEEAEKASRDRRYLDHLWEIPRESQLLKLADRIHNLRSIPQAGDPAKARRYLDVSRSEFLPLALAVDATAARLISEACDAIEAYLAALDETQR